MVEPGITPSAGHDPDIHWLLAQHDRDLAALDRAADERVVLLARIVSLEREKVILLLQARRDSKAH